MNDSTGFFGVFFAILLAGIILLFANSYLGTVNVQDLCPRQQMFERVVYKWDVKEGDLFPPNSDSSYQVVATIPNPDNAGQVFVIFQKLTLWHSKC